MLKKILLNLFDEGGAGEAGEGIAGESESFVTRETEEGAENPEIEEENVAPEKVEISREEAWKKAKADFKDLYSDDVSDIIGKRFKEAQSAEKYKAKLTSAFSPFLAKYGVDNLESLAESMKKDRTLYEEDAALRNMDPEDYMEFINLKAENDSRKAENERLAEEIRAEQQRRAAQAQYDGWIKEADELSKIYPGFDLKAELENPDFVKDLELGRSMKRAYQTAHIDEILKMSKKDAVKAAQENMKANASRVSEVGAKSSPAVSGKIDVNKLTDEQLDELSRRARRGEVIRFT